MDSAQSNTWLRHLEARGLRETAWQRTDEDGKALALEREWTSPDLESRRADERSVIRRMFFGRDSIVAKYRNVSQTAGFGANRQLSVHN